MRPLGRGWVGSAPTFSGRGPGAPDVRDCPEELAGDVPPDDDPEELRELSSRSGGHSRGWRFDRDEIHERP